MLFQYMLNCFWLIVPVLLINLLLTRRLPPAYQPEVFSAAIPRWLAMAENVLRTATFVLPLLMPLHVSEVRQFAGLILYCAGLLLYCVSWLAQIYVPRSRWSRSRAGFFAPAYTPLVWLAGIAMISDRLYLPVRYSPWIYLGIAGAFLVTHNAHAWMVYSREMREQVERKRPAELKAGPSLRSQDDNLLRENQ